MLSPWWPELGTVNYAFSYELHVIQRKPVRKIVSKCEMLSQKEIQRALDLLGREGYDVMILAPSWWEMQGGFDTDAERPSSGRRG